MCLCEIVEACANIFIYIYVHKYNNDFLPIAYPLFFFLTVHNCDVFRYSQGSLFNGERKSVTQFDGTFTLAEKNQVNG